MFRTLLTVMAILVVAGAAGTVVADADSTTSLSADTTIVGSTSLTADTTDVGSPTSLTAYTAKVGSSTSLAAASVDAGPATQFQNGTANETDPAASPPFDFSIQRIENCGYTCRNVTLSLANEQEVNASDVNVTSRIYAGNGTDGEMVWSGNESVDTLAPGESVTRSERVDLSIFDAYAVNREGGWITVETTVNSSNGNMTVLEYYDAT